MTLPTTRRAQAGAPRRGPRWLVRAGSLLAIAATLAACGGARSTSSQTVTLPVRVGDLMQTVSSSGQLQALRESYLNFATGGTIAEVRVTEGQKVRAGEVLASLDTSDLHQQVVQAEANLKSAQANLADLLDGPDPEEVRLAESQLEVAKLQLEQTKRGTATAAQIASARASLRSAQANLEMLKNPTAADREAAEQAVREAEIALQSTRNSASANKTNAELALQKAVDALTQAQVRYATAKSDWDFVQETGQNPANPETTTAQGEKIKNKVSDTQRQQYYDAFVQAEAALRTAEANVTQAQVAYDNAREQEIADVQRAEAQLASAQRQLEALLNPTAAQIAQAEAQVAQAEAQLNALTSGGTQTDVAIAEQTVLQRQVALEELLAPPSEAEIAQAEAQVAQAEAALAAAKRELAAAQLVAPFDGTVAAVNITIGDSASASSGSAASADTAAIYLIDDSSYYVDVYFSEVDLAKLALDQRALVTIDALPGTVLEGKLTYIASIPTVSQNVTTYNARIDLEPTDAPLRVGLSAAVTIVVAEANGVLTVPNIAIQQTPDGAQVLVQRGGEVVPVTIETGLVGESQTEVRSGLSEGDIVVVTVSQGGQSQMRGPVFFGGPGGGPPAGGGPGGGQRPGGGGPGGGQRPGGGGPGGGQRPGGGG